MKIKHKLVVGFLLVALLVGVVGYISVSLSQLALKSYIGEASSFIAVETLDKIDRHIKSRIDEAKVYSHNELLQRAVAASNKAFDSLDDVQVYINKKDQEWTSAPKEVITSFMQDLINNEPSQELRKLASFYEEEYSFPVFGEIFVTNKYGANAAQTGKTSDYYQADEEWWQSARINGLYLGDVGYDESAGVYSTDIGIRIDDDMGNFIGVMKAVLNIEEVITIIKDAESSLQFVSARFKLFDGKGRIIYSTDDGNPSLEATNEEELEMMVGQTGHFIIKESDGEEELHAYARSRGYHDFGGLDWILLVEYKTEELLRPVNELKNVLILVSLGIAIIAALIGLIISFSISRPIAALTDAADKFRRGKLKSKVKITSDDEIGDLAETFNEMRLGLKDRNELLDTILKAFKGKVGGIASILLRKNILGLAEKNPRVLKILPKSIGRSFAKEKKWSKQKKKN